MGWFKRDKSEIDPNSEHRDWQLVSEIAQESIKEQRRARKWGIFFKSVTAIYLIIFLVILFGFLGAISQSQVGGNDLSRPHTALVVLEGMIADDQMANADHIASALRSAFASESSRGVILKINSPGGSPVQSGYIYDEIKRLRVKYPDKKLYAVISDLGASGGYFVAAAADEIYADKASLIGSIGVTASSFGFVDLMEKLGVERRTYSSGEHKGFLDPFVPQREDETQFWQQVLESTHQQFIRAVKEGRGDRLVQDDQLFTGLIWNGEQALDKGLIDGLGSAGYVAREIIGQEKIYDYTVRLTPFEEFSERLGMSIGQGIATFVHNLSLNTTLR